MNTQNRSFINKNCDICGKSELVLSTLNLCCNYGSKNDGEELTLTICGSCADKIYKTISVKEKISLDEFSPSITA